MFPRTEVLSGIAAIVLGGLLLPVETALAQASPDSRAALLVYPHVKVDTARGIDTVVQLSNTRNTVANVQCFYVAADQACSPTSFEMRVTASQPLGWRAGNGLSRFPLADLLGPSGQRNDRSLIPPVPGDPFEGSLWCLAVDGNSRPAGNNALIGTATVERFDPPHFDAAAYNAIGVRGLSPAVGDSLLLGGALGTYESCARTLTAVHYLDGALDAPTKASRVSTRLVIVPCTLDLSKPAVSEVSMQYEVTNEFEQRLAVRREQIGCEQSGTLSSLDADDPERSIFNASVSGTLTAQTRVYASGGTVGILALGIETQTETADPGRTHSAMFTVATIGQRLESDVITLPGLAGYPPCTADCSHDRRVTVDELQRCVNIALGETVLDACPQCDADSNGTVSVEEIIGAVGNALGGCPRTSSTPAASPTPRSVRCTPTPSFFPPCPTCTPLTCQGGDVFDCCSFGCGTPTPPRQCG